MELHNLQFIEDVHEYIYVDGDHVIRIPSVHEVMEYCGLMSTDYVPQEAMERGKYIHAATEVIDEGGEVEAPEEWKPYVKAYEQFVVDEEPFYEESEIPILYNDDLIAYAGTKDRRMLGIMDIKTGGYDKWHFVQLAAYTCGDESDFDRCGNLYLLKDGTYKYRPEKKHRIQFGWRLFHGACLQWWFKHLREWNKLQKFLKGHKKTGRAC